MYECRVRNDMTRSDVTCKHDKWKSDKKKLWKCLLGFSKFRSVIKRKNNPTHNYQTVLLHVVIASFYNCYRVSVIEKSDDRATRGKQERKRNKRTKSKERRKEKTLQKLNVSYLFFLFTTFIVSVCQRNKQRMNHTRY